MAKSKVKVVMGIYNLNFCDQIEFEGSKAGAADIVQIGRGQAFQKGIQIGSTYDAESGEWGNLVQAYDTPQEVESSFGAGFGEVPLDPQVVAAKEAEAAKLEADRQAAEELAKQAVAAAEGEKKEFILP